MSCELKVHLTCNGCGKEAESGQGWFAIDENWGSLFVLELARWSIVTATSGRTPSGRPPYWAGLAYLVATICAAATSGAPEGALRQQPEKMITLKQYRMRNRQIYSLQLAAKLLEDQQKPDYAEICRSLAREIDNMPPAERRKARRSSKKEEPH